MSFLKMDELFEILFAAYGRRNWWPAKTPFEMMVGAILTQNTNWSNVQKAIAGFGDNLTPQFIQQSDTSLLAEIIRPSGYYNQKAVRLKTLAQWYEGYGCDIERVKAQSGETLRDELLSLCGVGHETAYSMLLYAFDKPYFVVDAYTRRLLERLSYTLPPQYDELRIEIEQSIPQELYFYNEFHALIVQHAKVRCKKNPACEGCPLQERCAFYKEISQKQQM